MLASIDLNYSRQIPNSRAASSVPSTLEPILLKAVSRAVEVSSAKGAKPQSSVVPVATRAGAQPSEFANPAGTKVIDAWVDILPVGRDT
jgi:hypothetical protein